MTDHLIGRWAVCNRGLLGKVERFQPDGEGRSVAYGRTTDGRNWQSVVPRYLSISESMNLDRLLETAQNHD